ncbi:hypothetical protein H5410_040191 [Solanum commersonii]|uniref:Uncharacterized protein n=1 Tax=Solanum commersonii TaxID=4109 RepID=A0A9J5XPD9_SOLCO|nr:hypothetical protein H5410_040191 [Solanum commersonii]
MSDDVEEFKRIQDYKDELLRKNPGSTCVVKLSEETFEGRRKMFQPFYICFDSLKKEFKAGARRCIRFNGFFLKDVAKVALHFRKSKLINYVTHWLVLLLLVVPLEEGRGIGVAINVFYVTKRERGIGVAVIVVGGATGRERGTGIAITTVIGATGGEEGLM